MTTAPSPRKSELVFFRTDRVNTPITLLCHIAVLSLCACSRDGLWLQTQVPKSVVSQIQGERKVVELRNVDTLRAIGTFQLPDSVASMFKLSMPTMLATDDPPSCNVAIGDVVDRAVHVFRADGSYSGSFYGGGRDQAEFRGSGLSSVSFIDNGKVAASTNAGRVVIFDTAGRKLNAADLGASPDSGDRAVGNQIVVGPDGLIYDHWFAGEQRIIRAKEWAGDPSLVRVFNQRGQLVRTIGRVVPFPGVGLTHYLNRGEIRIRDDTLWFARRADARILAFPLQGPYDRPARVISLPVYYRADLPIEYVTRDSARVAVRIQEHLRTFSIGPSGDFYVVQSRAWPKISSRGIAWVPRSVIAEVARDGVVRKVYSFDNNFIALTAESNQLVGVTGQSGHLKAIRFVVVQRKSIFRVA